MAFCQLPSDVVGIIVAFATYRPIDEILYVHTCRMMKSLLFDQRMKLSLHSQMSGNPTIPLNVLKWLIEWNKRFIKFVEANWAIESDDPKSSVSQRVKFLLDNGIDCHYSVFEKLCEDGDLATIKEYYIHLGKRRLGKEALENAVKHNTFDVVQFLVENKYPRNRDWCLAFALRKGDLRTAQYLFDNGYGSEGTGFWEMKYAAEGGNFAAVQWVINHGFDRKWDERIVRETRSRGYHELASKLIEMGCPF